MTKTFSLEHRQKISVALTGVKRGKQSPEHVKNRVAAFPRKYSEEHWNWKGDEVSYSALHKWIYRHLGKVSTCSTQDETCSSKFEWSNISGEYKRDFNDWRPLCASHHRRNDGYNVKPAFEAWMKKCKQKR